MDYFIIVSTTLAGLLFHAWLYRRIRRWIARDLALSMAGDDADKRSYMLERLQAARRRNVPRKRLQAFLEQASADYPQTSPANGTP